MKTRKMHQVLGMVLALTAAIVVGPDQAAAEGGVTPPDMTVCNGVDCTTLQYKVCSPAGYSIALTNYEAAATSNNGTATYTYQICSPPPGICTGNVRNGESCLDNLFCQEQGPNYDPSATCDRKCAADTFRELSHFDVVFPALGGPGSCLGSGAQVTGSCTAVDNTPNDGHAASVYGFVLGDGACFSSGYPVAKCDSTDLYPGDCVVMTVSIPGETNGLGLGAAVVVDKEAPTCTASCLAGPSCDSCQPEEGSECLTRTRGFWGTHPDIAAQYDPVKVCGFDVDGQDAGTCSTSEALCTSGNDNKKNPTYLSLVAQLTAAKLNLNATYVLFKGTCSSWSYGGKTIQKWIDSCENNYCNEKKQNISTSGCIEALTAFNESQDTGFDVTPPPFDRPGRAKVEQCQLARGNGKYIGSELCQ